MGQFLISDLLKLVKFSEISVLIDTTVQVLVHWTFEFTYWLDKVICYWDIAIAYDSQNLITGFEWSNYSHVLQPFQHTRMLIR